MSSTSSVPVPQSSSQGDDSAAESVVPAESAPGSSAQTDTPVGFNLPPRWFPVRGTALCRAIPATPGRKFGVFVEKTLQCDGDARRAIDHVCDEGGFTQSWLQQSDSEAQQGIFTMRKLPVIVLVKLMLGLPESDEAAVQSLRGAYAICMDPSGELGLPLGNAMHVRCAGCL